jgi:GntR family transcriptional regulator, rspAB operon transcriptional repressor
MHEPGGHLRAVSETRTLEVYRLIKNRILRLEMPPESSLTEAEVAIACGTSKTPVREALAHLQRDGLVEVVGRTGYRVTPITLKQTRDLFGLRIVLEGEAAALAASYPVQPEQIRQLEELSAASYRPDDASSVSAFLARNTDLHLAIAQLGRNDRLAAALHGVLEELVRPFHVGLTLAPGASEITHEHAELIAAIIAGDVAAARSIAVAHGERSQAMVIDALVSSDVLAQTSIIVPSK